MEPTTSNKEPQRRAYVVGTFDTKGDELRYLASAIRLTGIAVTTVDIGLRNGGGEADVPPATVAALHPLGADGVLGVSRNEALGRMAEALTLFLKARDDVGAVVGVAGSSGTAMISTATQALPIGLPKLIVSPVAAGDVGPYVGTTDTAMLFSVTDLAGLNRVTRQVLSNAAHAVAGMVRHGGELPPTDNRTIALTGLGVTTECVSAVSRSLRRDADCLVFPAVKTGMAALVRLIDERFVEALVDITPADIVGAVLANDLAAVETRFASIAASGIPYVGSCGGLDMLIVGGGASVPPDLADRRRHQHTPAVTLVRPNVSESAAIGKLFARLLNSVPGPVRILAPERGLSALSAAGGPFHDSEADAALFDALESTLSVGDDRTFVRLPHAMNEPEFSRLISVTVAEAAALQDTVVVETKGNP
jgi:uncharacterized protein (UPF0261 family)